MSGICRVFCRTVCREYVGSMSVFCRTVCRTIVVSGIPGWSTRVEYQGVHGGYVGYLSGLCRGYVGILSDRTSVLRRDYVGGYVGLYGGYVGSQGKPR